jgi:hypothetical protein
MQLKHRNKRFKSLQILHKKKVFQSEFKFSQGDELSSSMTNSELQFTWLTLTLNQELTANERQSFLQTLAEITQKTPHVVSLSLSLCTVAWRQSLTSGEHSVLYCCVLIRCCRDDFIAALCSNKRREVRWGVARRGVTGRADALLGTARHGRARLGTEKTPLSTVA